MSQSKSPKGDRIRSLAMFETVDRKALAKLEQATDELTLKLGYTMIEEGRLNTEVFIVESGTADVLVGGKSVAEVGPGEVVGELAFFSPGAATATVVAKTEMTVLLIPYNRFQAVIDETPEVLSSVVRDLAGRLRKMDARNY